MIGSICAEDGAGPYCHLLAYLTLHTIILVSVSPHAATVDSGKNLSIC